MSSFPEKLADRFRRFHHRHFLPKAEEYEELATYGQNPEAMVISCSDSRVDPETIFSAMPGELFVVRNVANLVPPYETGGKFHGVSSAIEFAVLNLRVKHLIVMGHSGCGGVKAALDQSAAIQTDAQFISRWMSMLDDARLRVLASHQTGPHSERLQALEKEGVKTAITQPAHVPVHHRCGEQGPAVAARGLLRHRQRDAVGAQSLAQRVLPALGGRGLRHGRCSRGGLRLRDGRHETLLHALGGDRPDVLVDDLALAIDDERLGHAVDAPLDRRAAGAVGADGRERIAVAAEEAARRRRMVLVVDAVEGNAGALLQFDQQRVLLDARARTTTPRSSRRSTLPLASSVLAKPGTGLPSSTRPSRGANCVAGAGLPISADGSFEGSPVFKAKANTATSAAKMSNGAITQPRLLLRADGVPSAPGCMAH